LTYFSIGPVLGALKRARVKCGCLNGLDFLWLEITRPLQSRLHALLRQLES
jgi:hypothetical protein